MQSIDRAVAILDILGRHEHGLSVSEITSTLGLPLGTTHRFLTSLMDNALVVQDPSTKAYRLGWRILSLASQLVHSSRLIQVARQHMARTAASVGKMVFLCQEHNGEIVCVASATDPGGLHMKFYVQLGSIMPFHASASAKIIFAYSPQSVLQQLFAGHTPLPHYTARTLSDPEAILQDLAQCRQQGYAVCDEEMEIGVQAVAAPVFGFDRAVTASVGIIGIKADEVPLARLIEEVQDCARLISRDVGFTPATGAQK